MIDGTDGTAKIALMVTPDKKKLSKSNGGSQADSTYVREGNPDKFKCTAK